MFTRIYLILELSLELVYFVSIIVGHNFSLLHLFDDLRILKAESFEMGIFFSQFRL